MTETKRLFVKDHAECRGEAEGWLWDFAAGTSENAVGNLWNYAAGLGTTEQPEPNDSSASFRDIWNGVMVQRCANQLCP